MRPINLKRRLLGFVLTLPLVGMSWVAAPTCQRGAVKGMGGPGLGSEWLNNLAALGLMLSVPMAIVGLVLFFGRAREREGR